MMLYIHTEFHIQIPADKNNLYSPNLRQNAPGIFICDVDHTKSAGYVVKPHKDVICGEKWNTPSVGLGA